MSFTYWEANYRQYTSPDVCDGWLRAYAREIIPGSAVLDLGCGQGTNIPDLLHLGARISAADFSKKAISALQDRYSKVLERMDCFDMRAGFPYANDSFDIVIADLSLHYFSWQETAAIISEIRRILKKGGRLIARVHSLAGMPDHAESAIEDHYYMENGCARRYFTADELRDLFFGWDLQSLQPKQIHRYRRVKHVFEFTAGKS